jgi:hypothetical protein
MEPAVEIRWIWGDQDIDEILISAWSGAFGGVAKQYVNVGELARFADVIRKFPTHVRDQRSFTLGGSNELRFSTVDGAAHCVLEARITDDLHAKAAPDTVFLRARFEPAALDEFVDGLTKAGRSRSGTAKLRLLSVT